MKLKKVFYSLVLLCTVWFGANAFLQCEAMAGDISITEIKIKHVEGREIAEITVNNFLKISEIGVSRPGGRTLIKFPEYVSKKMRVYPQARFLTRQANEAVRNAVETGKPSVSKGSAFGYKITRYSPYRKTSKLKAFITLNFCDAVEVECKIIETKGGPMVAWPSRKPSSDGKWIDQVSIIDKRIRENIELDLLEKYYQMSAEGQTGEDGWEENE